MLPMGEINDLKSLVIKDIEDPLYHSLNSVSYF